MIYTVEDNTTTYSIKGTLRDAKTYADWLITNACKDVHISQRHLVRKPDVTPSKGPDTLFDNSYRVVRTYRKVGEKWF